MVSTDRRADMTYHRGDCTICMLASCQQYYKLVVMRAFRHDSWGVSSPLSLTGQWSLCARHSMVKHACSLIKWGEYFRQAVYLHFASAKWCECLPVCCGCTDWTILCPPNRHWRLNYSKRLQMTEDALCANAYLAQIELLLRSDKLVIVR